ncbi:hypothetical protein [Agitococcus lubricus]|uniref:Cysteinyl-tRNA synthetase n=1 Tax=Agitococcus lubricus TaxID=1077255 RepID=A0A2T5IWG8_9GAMM|nr:hypothetical protein [Agitococcus lubricus]PTQ88237.1 hypothetical protein C8N29_1133 [Agitococcus lubricus]
MIIDVDGLKFNFATNWQASKYDEWSYYRNQFVKQFAGIKAVDLLAISPKKITFLIEVKDYTHPNTEKPSDLPQAVADKVLNTLAALLPCSLLANDATEKAFAKQVLLSNQLHVVLHMEQPRAHKPVVDAADVLQKLKKLLRAVDAHPKVVSIQNNSILPWNVSK